MELEATKVTIVTNGIGLENSLRFDFGGEYFKVSRPGKNKILQFETKNNTIEIPIEKLSTKKDKRWIKFDTKSGYIFAYFFIKDTEKNLAKDIICEITKSENPIDTLIFKFVFDMKENKSFDRLLNIFYDITVSNTTTSEKQIIQAKEVMDYDLENGGFYTITFVSENNGYFSICRDFDEEDETIYIEMNEQCNSLYAFPQDIKYSLGNGIIEFVFSKDFKLEPDFGNHIVVKFPIVSQEQLNLIKLRLENIWGK